VKYLTIFLTLFCVHSVCAVDLYKQFNETFPLIDDEREVYLGDQILFQRYGQYKDCITPKFDDGVRLLGSDFNVVANKPACKEKQDSKVYMPTYTNSIQKGSPYRYGLRLKNKRNKLTLCVVNVKCLKRDVTEDDFDFSSAFIPTSGSLNRKIEYSGKKGKLLTFAYIESKDELREGPERGSNIIKEFEVDLNEGNIGAYKGALFEILDATNASIKYKVIRHFPAN
jgi:hypothetical protein